MEDTKEVRGEVKVGQNEKVNRKVGQELWRLLMVGTSAGVVSFNVTDRGFTYLFSDLSYAERINDVDAFFSLFGQRLENFRDREAEERLGLSRANVVNLSERYEIEIDWEKIYSLPQTESLRGASLTIIITDEILPAADPEELEALRRRVSAGGNPVEVFVGGIASEIGGTRRFFPGIDDYAIMLTTVSHLEMPIETRSEFISRALAHEVGHVVNFREEATVTRFLKNLENTEDLLKEQEEFAYRYTEENRDKWAQAVSLRPIEQPLQLSKEELDQVNNILVGLQVEARLGSLEPAKPYWKKGIEV